jgi:hypothetical protein
MKKKTKHTAHSRIRAYERAFGNVRQIEHNLKYRKFIGLPRQTLNKRVALMKVDNEWIVVIWTKESKRIVTVMKYEMYAKTHLIPDSAKERMTEK